MNKLFLICLGVFIIFASGCSRKSSYRYSHNVPAQNYSADKSQYNTRLSQKAYKHPTMNPYRIHGVKYYPHDTKVGAIYNGNASWYGPAFHGKLTSNGETYNMYDMTSAHKTLPMNTVVKVTNKNNGRSIVVRINDRGPFIATRIIDLSKTAARKLDVIKDGTAPVRLEVLGFYSKNKRKTYQTKQTQIKKPSTKKEAYSLQIASFSNIEGALKTQEKYDNVDGYKSVIKDVEVNGQRFFKVYLKGFNSEQEIRRYKANSEFSNSFIVKD